MGGVFKVPYRRFVSQGPEAVSVLSGQSEVHSTALPILTPLEIIPTGPRCGPWTGRRSPTRSYLQHVDGGSSPDRPDPRLPEEARSRPDDGLLSGATTTFIDFTTLSHKPTQTHTSGKQHRTTPPPPPSTTKKVHPPNRGGSLFQILCCFLGLGCIFDFAYALPIRDFWISAFFPLCLDLHHKYQPQSTERKQRQKKRHETQATKGRRGPGFDFGFNHLRIHSGQ